MKNENIEMLIDALNAGQMADRIFRTKLAPTVEYARVWLGLDDLIDKLKVLDERIRSLIQDAHERLES